MSVAKPWMEESPAPTMSHSLAGLPGLQFSATISLPGEEQPDCKRIGTGPATLSETDPSALSTRTGFELIKAICAPNQTNINEPRPVTTATRDDLTESLVNNVDVRFTTARHTINCFTVGTFLWAKTATRKWRRAPPMSKRSKTVNTKIFSTQER